MFDNKFRSPRKKGRIAVFLSGRGSNFIAIHNAIKNGNINGDISVVFSNKKDSVGLQTAKKLNLETFSLRTKAFPTKKEYDNALRLKLKKYKIDLICLAGYMKILTREFCIEYENRIMNIHPALLPSFPGLHVQKKALDWGVRYAGATVHFVIPDVDMGPIITQAVVPVHQDDSEDSLSQRILKEEHRIFPEAIKLYFEGRLEIRERRVFIL